MNWDVKAIHENRGNLSGTLLKSITSRFPFFDYLKQVRSKVNYEDIELPEYKSHKTVKAFKIYSIDHNYDGAILHSDTVGILPALVTYEWYANHLPLAGGYFVVYEDGYESYSPAKPFEEGYTLVEGA